MARTNISVDQVVFDEFSEQAAKQNKTLFAFANEALTAISKVSSEGGNPTDLYKFWTALTLLKQVDVITLPSDFIDELIARQYSFDKKNLLKMFSDLGSQIVGVLKIAASDLDQLEGLARDFFALIPIKKFKITKLDDSTIEVAVVGAGRKIESTECSSEFLKSILAGYGYTPLTTDINIGTIRMQASKSGPV